jgi:predicted acyl esterase
LLLIPLLGLLSCKPQPESLQPVAQPASEAPAAVSPAGDKARNSSVYIAMPDDVLLAAEIYLPADASKQKPVPAIVEFTRYWRAIDMVPQAAVLPEEVRQSLDAGYAYVAVDVRGTGASQGVRKAEFSLAEARDMPHVIEWISTRDWSNGKVAALGISYPGNTAEMTALFRHPALVASVPRFTDFDWYTSIVVPGGLKNAFITVRWGESVRMMDLNDTSLFGPHEGEPSEDNPLILGVRPVDTDSGGEILAAATRAHSDNTSLADHLDTLVYRDEYPVAESLDAPGDKAVSIHRHRVHFEEVALPMYHWGSWFDAGTAAGILSRFSEWDVPYRFIIGPWSHGANHDANPYREQDAAVEPSVDQQYEKIFAFLDPFTRGAGDGAAPQKELVYFTVGEDAWKATRIWPPEGQVMERWFLGNENTLVRNAPERESSYDEYRVDFEAGSGSSSRWATQLGGGDVFYGDRSEADERLLTYTSEPLDADTEITGSAVISLEVSSSHEDGAFIVYLEDVAPDGYVRMLTEGELRAVHRAVIDKPGHETLLPFHSFEEKEGQAMVPGEVTTITFALLPVSALVRQGHAIRVAIAGHDKDTFIRVPETGDPVIRVFRQKENASWIDLPVIHHESRTEL